MHFKYSHLLIALVTVLLFASCKTPPVPATGTIIKGKIQMPSEKNIYFYSYRDSLDYFLGTQSLFDSSVVEDDGSFLFNLNINTPHVFSLKYGSSNIVSNLFIQPDDLLEINFNGQDNIPNIIPFGSAARFNTFLLNFIETFYKEPVRKNEYYVASNYMDMHQYRSYTERREKDMKDFYNNYFKEEPPSEIQQSFILNSITYELASDRLMYLWKKRMKGEAVTPDSLFLNFETPAIIENESAFISPSYIRFLNLYIKDSYERLVETGDLPENKNDTLIPAVEKYRIAKERLTGKYREAVLFNIFITDQDDITRRQIVSKHSALNLDSLTIDFKAKYSLE